MPEEGDEHIEHIRRALWSRPHQHGASVMVGAGFSLNAVPKRSGAPPFLVWRQLLSRFEQRLGYAADSGRGTSDALRLASEFESAFGPTALEELLRDSVPDEHYRPGPLHSLLMSLPWAEVFTTNYDRFLENVAIPGVRYPVVRTAADIASAARPRIVKLHGSFPSSRPFIITEEHYRTYPRHFAPFVNLVQQAVMETVFCLVGFSGDDPNFLQWAGWVRDNLGDAAPPIYLCGVHDLTSAQRYLLQSRRVVPVDLAPRFPKTLPSDVRHARALEWFLLSLKNGEPPDLGDWPTPPEPHPLTQASTLPPLLTNPEFPPAAPPEPHFVYGEPFSVDQVETLLTSWFAERSWYPGWITLPEPNRTHLSNSTADWLSEPGIAKWSEAMAILSPAEQILAWYELGWRMERCLLPLITRQAKLIDAALRRVCPFPDFLEGTADISRPSPLSPSSRWPRNGPRLDWDEVSQAWVELAFMVLRNAREEFDDGTFQEWSALVVRIAHIRPEWRARLLREQSSNYLYRLELTNLRSSLESWDSDSSSPYLNAQRAALLGEAGRSEAARAGAEAALRTLQEGPPPGQSTIRTMSEEGWLLWLVDIVHDGSFDGASSDNGRAQRRRQLDKLEAFRCDPREHVAVRGRKLRSARLSSTERRARTFDPGRWTITRSINRADPPTWLMLRLLDQGCAPLRASNVVVFSDDVSQMARIFFRDGEVQLATSLLLRVRDSSARKAIDELFSQATVATLDQRRVDVLYRWIARIARESVSVLDSNADDRFADGLLGPCCEIISRLIFRLAEADRIDAMRLANDIYERSGGRADSPAREIAHMYRRLFYAMSRSDIANVLPVLLGLPVFRETGEWHPEAWAEPFDEFRPPESYSVAPNPACVDQISRLVRQARSKDGTRGRAIRRLTALHKLGALTEAEGVVFGDALWSHLDAYGLPSDTGILPGQFMWLPHPPETDPRARLKAMLIDARIPGIIHTAGGIRSISSADASSASRYIRMIEWASRSPLRRSEPAIITLEWTPGELSAVLRKLTDWTANNLPPGRRILDLDLGAAPMNAVCSIVGNLFVPLGMQDTENKRAALELARFLGTAEDCPLACAPVDLIDGHRSAGEVRDRLITALHAMDGSEERMTAAGNGLLLWVGYSESGLINAEPTGALEEVVAVISSVRQPGLAIALDVMAAVAEEFPARIDGRMVGLVLRTLDYLVRGTALPSRGPTTDDGLEVIEELASIRASAARLAFRLHAYHTTQALPAPPVLERWREICATDVLPEVRRQWPS